MKTFKTTFLFLVVLLSSNCNEEVLETSSPFQSFDGVNIAYTDQGEGEPVILIHGFISNGTSWDKTVLKKLLIEKGYRVIVPDLRGNGKSDRPQTLEAYRNDAETKDLRALAKYLNLEKYTAIAYSRGSIVLAKLLTLDKKIDTAVLGGMGLDFTNPDWDRRIMFADAFGGKVALNADTEGAVNYAKSINADMRALHLLQKYQPVTSIADLAKIKARTLVIAGDVDKDNGDPADLQGHIPGSELKIIPGDHNNAYKSEIFAETVMAFLEKR